MHIYVRLIVRICPLHIATPITVTVLYVIDCANCDPCAGVRVALIDETVTAVCTWQLLC